MAKGVDKNEYVRPAALVTAEMRQMQQEMTALCMTFSALCDRMEQCARQVRGCSVRADRQMFQAFFDAGCIPGKYVSIIGSKNPNSVYKVDGVDGFGFYLTDIETGKTIYVNILERSDLPSKIRPAGKKFREWSIAQKKIQVQSDQ
jgi:hypothetical protein